MTADDAQAAVPGGSPGTGAVAARVGAIILAGGRGARLGGVDKPALVLGGTTLLARAIGAVRAVGAAPVIAVGPERAGVDAIWAREDPPFGGPAAALATGLAQLVSGAAAPEFVLVLSADLRKPDQVVAALLSADRGADGTLLVDADAHRQWLCGLYRRSALTAAFATSGDPSGTSLGRLLSGLDVREHPVADAVVADVDTPADARDAGIVLP